MLFSQKYGYNPVREQIQKESMDEALRNQLWNIYFDLLGNKLLNAVTYNLLKSIWTIVYKQTSDTFPIKYGNPDAEWIRNIFISGNWYDILDVIQFTVIFLCKFQLGIYQQFINSCNDTLEQECSAYRIVGKEIAPITTKEEIESIESAINTKSLPVREHLSKALDLFSNRQNPNYRNSIKESISAVEYLCKKIANDDNADLAKAIKILKNSNKIDIHPAFEQALIKLYAYTSDEDGIRHCIMDKDTIESEDAKYMLVTCAAFVNYLMAKCERAKIVS